MITFNHFNFNVLDLEKSLAFYKEALNLEPVREKNASDGSFKLVYLGDGVTDFTLELTWLRESANSTWHSMWMILTAPTSTMRRWDASATRILAWEFISSRTRTVTGWKSCLLISRGHIWKGGGSRMEGPDTGLHGSYPVPALDNSVYIGPEGKRKADREMYL